MRRSVLASGGAVACTAAYYMVRVCEESFTALDDAMGIADARMGTAYWRSTHPGEALPAMGTVRRDNQSSIRTSLESALAAAAADLDAPGAAPTHRVTKAASSVTNSGDGAYLQGKVPRGSIATFYPGPVCSPIVGRIKLLFRSLTSSYVVQMPDSYMIDGSPAGATADGKGGTSCLCGPLCNHPPPGTRPNVMFFAALCDTDSLPAASADALRRISWYDAPPLTYDGRRLQRTMVLVALRDLEDEELFVDYQFDPLRPDLPHWYHPVRREDELPDCLEIARPGMDFFIHT